MHCAFRALWLGLSSNQFQKLIQPDAVTPCNDADRRIWLIRFLNDGKLLSSRPATPPLWAGQDFSLRIVTGHNEHITSLTY